MIQRQTRLHALQRHVNRLEKRVERLRATSESYLSRRLLDWLTATAVTPAVIAERQARVKELLRSPLFRDKLSVQTAMVPGSAAGRWPGQQIVDWLHNHPPISSLSRTLALLVVLALVNVTLGLLYLLELAPATCAWLTPGLRWWLPKWARSSFASSPRCA
jgi:hypothetical protein